MLKNLSFLFVAGLLASGCVIDLGNTTSATQTTTETSEGSGGESTTTSGTTTTGTTTEGTSEGTGTTAPTTTSPTTTEGTTGTTTEGTGGSTGTVSEYGKCGWNAEEKFYACDQFGGAPGVSDPDGVSPIDCPDMLPMVGDKCDETTAVNNVGCCLPTGQNWYCTAEGMIAMDECGV